MNFNNFMAKNREIEGQIKQLSKTKMPDTRPKAKSFMQPARPLQATSAIKLQQTIKLEFNNLDSS